MEKWFSENTPDGDWMKLRTRMMALLQDESKLDEMVKLVGMDALSAPDRLKMEAARSIREDFLHQDAFNDVDTYTSLSKQHLMMKLVLDYYDVCADALKQGANINKLVNIPVRERIGRFKYTPEDKIEKEYDSILGDLTSEVSDVVAAKEEF
jgi:V/A-type H+-transporting ATPase subunit A